MKRLLNAKSVHARTHVNTNGHRQQVLFLNQGIWIRKRDGIVEENGFYDNACIAVDKHVDVGV